MLLTINKANPTVLMLSGRTKVVSSKVGYSAILINLALNTTPKGLNASQGWCFVACITIVANKQGQSAHYLALPYSKLASLVVGIGLPNFCRAIHHKRTLCYNRFIKRKSMPKNEQGRLLATHVQVCTLMGKLY